MASPCDGLDDIQVDSFGSTTLQLDPLSGEPSRSVSPNIAGDLVPGSQHRAHFSSRPSTLPSSSRPILKPAFSEPLHVLSPPFTPPTPEDVGLGFYTDEGLSRSFYQQPPIGGSRRYSWHCSATPLPPHPQLQFFSVRSGAVSRAVLQCRSLTDEVLDGDMRGVWLLTQINHWDLELERLVLLCDCSLLVFKYDFIALRPLHFTRLPLRGLRSAVLGELVYPQRSLVPVITGLAEGVVSVLRSVLFPRLHSTLRTIAATVASRAPSTSAATGVGDVQRINGGEGTEVTARSDCDAVSSGCGGFDDKAALTPVAATSPSTTTTSTTTLTVAAAATSASVQCSPVEVDRTGAGAASGKRVAFDDSAREAAGPPPNEGGALPSSFAGINFEPRSRNLPGLRLYNKTAASSANTNKKKKKKKKTILTGASGDGGGDGDGGGGGDAAASDGGGGGGDGDGGVGWKQKWNPFCSSLPYHTLTSHPLYWYTADEDASTYDVVDLAQKLSAVLSDLSSQPDTATVCSLRTSRAFRRLVPGPPSTGGGATDDDDGSKRDGVGGEAGEEGRALHREDSVGGSGASPPDVRPKGGYGRIETGSDEEDDDEDVKLVVENYVGLVSLLHNATHLGYFKMRGKISF